MGRPWPAIAAHWVTRLALVGSAGALGIVSACDRLPPASPPGSVAGSEEDTAPLWQGKAVGELYEVGEVREFAFTQEGRDVGSSWGRYEGTVERDGETLHRFTTRIELRLAGAPMPARSEGEILVDSAGDLVEGFERSDAVVLRFFVRDGLLTLEAGRERDEMKHAPGDAYMAFMATMHEELMFGLRTIEREPMAWRISTLSGGLPAEWEGRVRSVEGDRIHIGTSLGEVVTLRNGRIERIEVADDALVVEAIAAAEAKWPQWAIEGPRELRYVPPVGADWSVRELELAARPGDPRIAGEVLVPREASEARPRPAVLFLAAAGISDRHGFAGPPPVDLGSHEITDALAAAGYVVLRYDEPGHGESEQAPLSWERQLEDARRALRMLMVQPEVDPSKIVVVGHGEGGWRGLVLAAERPGEVVGVALLAAPGRPYRQILSEQAEATIGRLDPGVREEARTQHRDLIAALASGEGVPPEFAVQARWLREIMDFDPAAFIARLDETRLLIAQGGKDFEVNVEADPLALDRAARRAKKRAELRRYAGLDHLFKPEPEEVSRPHRYREDRRVSPELLEDLRAWVARTTK